VENTGDRAQVRLPPPLLFLTCVLAAGLLDYLAPVRVVDAPIAIRTIPAVLFFGISGYVALHAVFVLIKHGTGVDPARSTTTIVSSGPFRFSRNPMYLALLVMLAGLAVLLASIWFLAFTVVLWLLLDRLAVQPEEKYLEAKFGDHYRAYRSRVRRWI
jgi:protein-S-isoprenylcysteine O-methyltransferase Ste14